MGILESAMTSFEIQLDNLPAIIGASTYTDGGVLLGSGTGASTAMAVLADGEMIVGDGATDPVPESGATLRTSIGVGTTDAVSFLSSTANHVDTCNTSATGTWVVGQEYCFDGATADPTGSGLIIDHWARYTDDVPVTWKLVKDAENKAYYSSFAAASIDLPSLEAADLDDDASPHVLIASELKFKVIWVHILNLLLQLLYTKHHLLKI